MKIGLTYDLRDDYLAAGFTQEETAEFDRLETIEALEDAIGMLGHQTERIGHLKALVNRLAQGDRWDLVFNIAEGQCGFGREAQVPAILEAYQIPCTFSDSLALALTLHKGLTKRIVRDLGIATPDFIVVEDQLDLADFNLPFPVFVKPVAEGTSKGINCRSQVNSPGELASACEELLARYRQPAIVETFLPGREYTAGILGTGRDARVIGVMEVILREDAEGGAYSYENKERYEDLVEYRLVTGNLADRVQDVSLAVWRGLGCRDAGRVDLREDERGKLNFLEINPLAGLHPHHSDLPIICSLLGIAYRKLIADIIASARKRCPLAAANPTYIKSVK
ncbi:MAG: hypothetical protein QMD32_01040 [Smithellaceae bacterium]|nr:hypothetical protein [Smithellaceae bacterium]